MTDKTEQTPAEAAQPPAVAETKALAPGALFGGKPTTFDEAWRFAQMIARTDLCPKDYRGNPESIMVAMQMGMEVGLSPMSGLQNIATINGRPSIWGDGLNGICLAHPKCESITETFDDETMTATCAVKRKGHELHIKKYSQADAVTAGLWTKAGSWKTDPKRMLQLRARSFALRDKFADALRGIGSAEEAKDIVVLDGEWSPGTEALPSELDSAKQITDALAGGEQAQDKSAGDEGSAGASADGQDGSGSRDEAPDSGDQPGSGVSPGHTGSALPDTKPRGRPSNLEKFKAEIAAAENVKDHWQDQRQLYQSKLGSDDYKKLAEFAEGLAFERDHPESK